MTKVVLQHVSDGEKKVFVEVSLIILVAVLSFVGMRMQSTQVDLTDRFILDGGIFFRSVLVPKKFDFLDWLFIVACGFSVFKHLISDVVFGFSYLDSGFSSTQAAIMRFH